MPCCGGNDDERRTDADGDPYYGECLKYDKNFRGPLSKRSCTDVSCLLIFIVFLGCWGFVGHYAYKNGDLDRLLVPTDSQGRKCGIDNGVVDKKYLLFFDLSKCIDPTVPLFGCPTPQVCVSECPQKTFIYNENECNYNTLEGIRRNLRCTLDVDMNMIQSCDHITQLVNAKKCAKWYLRSESFLKRCISGLPTSECPFIPTRFITQYQNRRVRSTLLDHIDEDQQHQRSARRAENVSDLIALGQLGVEPPVQCEERRKLGQQILIEKGHHVDSMLSRFVGNFIMHFSNLTESQQMGQMIVEDIIETYIYIFVGLLVAMGGCLIIIALMRWMATPLVWLSIIGVIGMLGFATYYCFTQFVYLKNNPPTDQTIVTNVSKFVEKWKKEKNTWLGFGIVAAVVLFIILLIVLVLRKRIKIAIALVKEGSKAVSSITSTVFFPIFPWIFQIAIIGFALIVGLYLASVGNPINQIVRKNEDPNCICTGPASGYVDRAICSPTIFNQYCQDTSTTTFAFFGGASTSKPCKLAACNFKELQSDKIVTYFQAINLVGFFWSIFFVTAFGEMVLAATFATWYWTFNKTDVPYFTLTVGLGRTVRYHLGTLAFGSLIITICAIIRVILEFIDRKLKKYDNDVTKCLLCCCKCFFWCLDKFLRFLNKNAYIMCAIHGKPFCTSARDAFNLLMRNFLRVIALDQVTDFLFFLTKILITAGMGVATYFYFKNDQFGVQLHYVQVPVVIVMIGTYLIASVFFGVYSMAVDTLFMCFLEDTERNDGSAEKPYFMSKQLMKILGKKNNISRDARH